MRKEQVDALFSMPHRPVDSGRIEDHLNQIAENDEVQDLSIAVCCLRIEESGPILCALLERAANGEPLTDDETNLLFFGVHILGGARFTPAFEPLLRLLRCPEEQQIEQIGDITTEILPRIAAGVFDGNAPALFAAIADPRTEQFARDSLFGAATYLTWEGRIDRDEMWQFLVRFDAERAVPDHDTSWTGWAVAIALLGFSDLAPLARQAWTDGRIVAEFYEPDRFDRLLWEAEAAPGDIGRLEAERLGYIEDVLESLKWIGRMDALKEFLADDMKDASLDTQWEPHAPVINEWRHVGRNDPCPCGSGKKAKKCCL